MGTPLPENPAGEHNGVCWGIGKAFGDNQTPEVVQIRLWDWQLGVFWDEKYRTELELPHLLYQTADPRVWIAENDILVWAFRFVEGDTFLVVGDPFSGEIAFNSGFLPICTTSGANIQTNFNDGIAYNGFFEITWNGIFN